MANEPTPSKWQAAIISRVCDPHGGNILVQACAGAGKSKTLEMIVHALRRNRRPNVELLAFNKTIAMELKKRGLPASTFNSTGYRIIRQKKPGVVVNLDKQHDVMKATLTPAENKLYGSVVRNLVDKAYVLGLVPQTNVVRARGLHTILSDTNVNWQAIADRFDIALESEEADIEEAFDLARTVMGKMLVDTNQICLNDQLLMPIAYNMAVTPVEYLLVDEAQDTNAVQMAIIAKLVGNRARLVAVGDRWQSLYAFRGADSQAMDAIKERFNCTEMLLPVTYRCPFDVVELARKYMPYIEAAEGAIKGTVETVKVFNPQTFQPGDVVVCRLNVPLVNLCYKLIAARVPAIIAGRDLIGGLVSQVRKIRDNLSKKPAELDEMQFLISALMSWKLQELAKAEIQESENKIQRVHDKFDTLMCVIESSDVKTIDELIAEIQTTFGGDVSNRKDKVFLTSIHKYKGEENERIFWLDPELTGRVKTDEDEFTETACKYVAITRTSRELYYLESSRWVG